MASDDYCYLTTTGRKSGNPHRIEIWYALEGDTLYLMSGGRMKSHWTQNVAANPAVSVELDGVTYQATARLLEDGDESERARTFVFDKYAPRFKDDLTEWRERALPVALDLNR